MGVPEFESGTSSLSATRSNQLSYTPVLGVRHQSSGDRKTPVFLKSDFRHQMGSGKFTDLRSAVKGKFAVDLPGIGMKSGARIGGPGSL